MAKESFADLEREVLQPGLCTTCGTCIGVCPVGCLVYDAAREQPALAGECTSCGICSAVCPGKDIPLLALEEKFLGRRRSQTEEYLGVYSGVHKGFANDPELRGQGASGGAVTALLLHALETGQIDAALVADMDPEQPWRSKAVLARTPDEIRAAAKSKYVLCPNNLALADARPGERLALVGLPCHVHGIRKMQSHPGMSKLAAQVVLVLGLYCGCNSSYQATEHVLADNTDIELDDIALFEYRGGPGAQDTRVVTKDGRELIIPNAVRSFSTLAMSHDRCRMCCDWTAELADVSLGDIFDPSQPGVWRKIPDWNSFLVRNQAGADLLESARQAGVLELSPLSEESFYGNIGFELKKHAAVFNYLERTKRGWPTPKYDMEFTWRARRKQDYEIPEE
jgi:coenzyme F420 hydrogenase subunit beta